MQVGVGIGLAAQPLPAVIPDDEATAYLWDSFTKLANPTELPTGIAWSIAWFEEYMVVGHQNAPFVTVYKIINGVFTKLDGAVSLTGSGVSVSFSKDGNYLAVGTNMAAGYVRLYHRVGDVFTEITGIDTIPISSGNVFSVALTPNADYLIAGQTAADVNNISVYKKNGDVYNLLAGHGYTSMGAVGGIEWSNDGNYSAYTGANPFPGPLKCAYVYKLNRATDTFSEITFEGAIQGTGPGGDNVTFSSDDRFLLASKDNVPRVEVFDTNGDTIVPHQQISPSTIVRGVTVTPEATYLALCSYIGEVLLYKRNLETNLFQAITSPTALGSESKYIRFSNEGRYLAVVRNVSPYIALYEAAG